MKVFKISLPHNGSGWCAFQTAEDAIADIRSYLDDETSGFRVTLEIAEMTEEEFKNLPEFEGW